MILMNVTNLGMILYYGIVFVFFKINFMFALVYVLFPYIEACNYLSGINFIWHAFCEPGKPGNEYIESTTIINGFYNVYNSDYHVVHHTNPMMQFTELPASYEKDRQSYIDNEATIFTGTHEYELLFWMMLKRYDLMVKHFVDLSGKSPLHDSGGKCIVDDV
jgi:fatty acid desaturase